MTSDAVNLFAYGSSRHRRVTQLVIPSYTYITANPPWCKGPEQALACLTQRELAEILETWDRLIDEPMETVLNIKPVTFWWPDNTSGFRSPKHNRVVIAEQRSWLVCVFNPGPHQLDWCIHSQPLLFAVITDSGMFARLVQFFFQAAGKKAKQILKQLKQLGWVHLQRSRVC